MDGSSCLTIWAFCSCGGALSTVSLTASFFSGVGGSTFITLSLVLLASGSEAAVGYSTCALVLLAESIFSFDSRLY